jgi:hypothetical protein
MRYCNMKIEEIWEISIPQLNYLLKQINEHVEFTIKCHTLSFGGLFGGVTTSSADKQQTTGTYKDETGEYVDGYKVADAEDMKWLASIL